MNYVAIYVLHAFLTEEIRLKIKSWNVEEACKKIDEYSAKYGIRPLYFCFVKTGITKEKYSGYYFINGKVRSLKEIKAERNPDNEILIENMLCNKWGHVVTVRGFTRPFEKNDSVIIWKT